MQRTLGALHVFWRGCDDVRSDLQPFAPDHGGRRVSVEFPLDAFDDAHVVVRRRAWPGVNRSKLASIAITAAIHLVLLAAAFRVVQGPPAEPPKVLMVQITPQSEKLTAQVAPAVQLLRPPVITSIIPEITVQSAPSAILAQPPAPIAASPQPVVPAPNLSGESRESYFGRLLAQLNRHKQYPRAARMARKQGVVLLHFVMDAQGRVSSFEIAKTSGYKELDNEALALIQRAQPLPPLPADYPTRLLDAVVPIEFSLDQRRR